MDADQGQEAESYWRNSGPSSGQNCNKRQCGVLSNACGPGQEPAEANVVHPY